MIQNTQQVELYIYHLRCLGSMRMLCILYNARKDRLYL